MRLAFLALLAILAALPALGQGPAPRKLPGPLLTAGAATTLAKLDAETLPPDVQPYTRYFFLGNPASTEQIQDLEILAAFAANSLNTRYRTAYIPPLVAGGRLLRVNLDELGISPKAWDNLGLLGSDPNNQAEFYFHRPANVVVRYWGGDARLTAELELQRGLSRQGDVPLSADEKRPGAGGLAPDL